MTNDKELATKFVFIDKGDSSVGIDGSSVYVEFQGTFYNADAQKEFVEAVKSGLQEFMDVDQIVAEHAHTCRHCKEVFKHIDDWCDDVCPKTECQQTEANNVAASYDEMINHELVAETTWPNSMPEHEVDFDKDYFRERNERILRGINGAGVRC